MSGFNLHLKETRQITFGDDSEITLKFEPRHFGALGGQALNYFELKEYEKAIESYEAVQKIYPLKDSAKKMIPILKELIDQTI